MQQCHLAVPVRAGQELPRRSQAAHPLCATLLGISTPARAVSAICSSSIDVGRGTGLCSVSTVTSAPS